MPLPVGPQRFLSNNRNLIADAILTPSDVQPVTNSVVETQLARAGTTQAKISGSYTGTDNAVYDFEIVDEVTTTKLISTPVFNGVGSETLADIVATSVTPQDFKIECHSAGQPAVAATVEIEGVSVVARTAGTAGNDLHIHVDLSGLVFDSTSFSLIEDVTKGSGSEASPLDGPQYDFDTATVGADGLIPTSAHRIAFEGDRSNIYVAYKKFVDNGWKYYTVPELANDYPAGTQILFVTGTYTVTISDSESPPNEETLASIVTLYDFLHLVKTTSVFADVDGVVANDRSTTGQASREFPLRTQARALLSTGEGSKAATGFEDITVETDANTELITAECIAIDFKLDPHAFVGHEAWTLKGSVSGPLGTIYTGEPFAGATFGLTIPVKTPPTSGNGAGTFSLVDFTRGSSDAPDVEVCFAGKLGPNAVDQTITLVYTARPPVGCECKDMAVPELNTRCLGGDGTGDTDMGYSAGAQTRIDDLYDWVSSLAAAVTTYIAGKAYDGIPDTTATSDTGAQTISFTNQGGGAETAASAFAGGNGIPFDGAPVDTGFADVALPSGFTSLIDQYDTTLQDIDALGAGAAQTAGFTKWDAAVTALKDDLNTTELGLLGDRLASVADRKYQIMLRRALAAGGISPVGKSNASNQSGDGCWQDFGDPFFWKVVGADGEYAPMFTNHAYWSSRKNADGIYFSTHEFAFILNVKCPQNLREGDTVTLSIGNSASLGTYQVGDILKLPLIAAADAFLTGGIAADNAQAWYVTGSVDGPFPVYNFDPDSSPPDSYSSGGIAFQLVEGAVAPANGDTFLFTVMGARYRYRKDGGAWSAETPVPAGATLFDAGLSIEFIPGVNPAFVASDRWTFRALQPWTAENVKSPDRARWFPGGTSTSTPTLKALSDGVKDIEAIAIALHTIPEGATIQVVGGVVDNVVDWTEVLTWQAGPIVKFVDRTAIWTRLELTTADGASVGWYYAGPASSTSKSSDFQMRRDYKLERGSVGGLYQGGAFLGKTLSGSLEWQPGSLTEADAAMLTALLDQVKSNNDESFIFVPQFTRPADALLVQIADDGVEITDLTDYNADSSHARKLSAKLALTGVWT